MDPEQIVRDVAEKVRALVAEAEEKASAIVREAEEEAKAIRDRAEVEGRERFDEVRKALDELQGKLSGAPAPPPDATSAAAASPGSEVDPGPVVVPEPEPPLTPEPGPVPVPEPTPDPVPEPSPEPIPEPTPPPDEGTPPVAASNGAEAVAKSDDAAGARLVAMNMALDGASKDEIEAKLAADYALDDPAEIADSVLALANK